MSFAPFGGGLGNPGRKRSLSLVGVVTVVVVVDEPSRSTENVSDAPECGGVKRVCVTAGVVSTMMGKTRRGAGGVDIKQQEKRCSQARTETGNTSKAQDVEQDPSECRRRSRSRKPDEARADANKTPEGVTRRGGVATRDRPQQGVREPNKEARTYQRRSKLKQTKTGALCWSSSVKS
jgi:hypothetical protein